MRNRLRGSILALAAVLAFSSVLRGQRAEDSREAKAQIVAARPDLSGVWVIPRESHAGVRRYGRGFGINPTFTKEEPPMTPWAEAKYKATNSAYEGANGRADLIDPVYSCFPPGVPRIYIEEPPLPMEIIQVPGRVIELFEYNHYVRQIYTDGREHSKDLAATWMGDSLGRWEGDTLVVDTTGFNEKTLVDKIGHPHSDSLHVVEHIRRVDRNTLVIDISIDDPKAYTKPWGGQLTFQLKPDWNIMEHVCEDNVNFNDFHKKSTVELSK